MQALKERYGIIDADLADRIHKDMFVVGHGQRTTVEVVGIERLNKQQRWTVFCNLLKYFSAICSRCEHKIVSCYK